MYGNFVAKQQLGYYIKLYAKKLASSLLLEH